MSDLNFSQQDELFDPRSARPVTVIGAGSVGSQVVTMLAKIGVTDITAYDGDSLESHNIPMSPYRLEDLGRFKVEALAEIVAAQSGVILDARPRMYEGEPLQPGAIICCADKMEVRSLVWARAKKLAPNVDLLVDTRTAAELVSVFAIDPGVPEDIACYETFLYPSSQAHRLTCGSHGIIYVSAMAASVACSLLTAKWSRRQYRRHLQFLAGALEFFDD